MYVEDSMCEYERFCFKPEILQVVKSYLNTPEGKKFKVGTIKLRYSKTVGEKYLSFGCPFCDAIFGDWFVSEAFMNNMDFNNNYVTENQYIELSVKIQKPITHEKPHWCYSDDRVFCS